MIKDVNFFSPNLRFRPPALLNCVHMLKIYNMRCICTAHRITQHYTTLHYTTLHNILSFPIFTPPFLCNLFSKLGKVQIPAPLPYLLDPQYDLSAYDVKLEVCL